MPQRGGSTSAARPLIDPLYARIMCDNWFRLAEPIRVLHSKCATTSVHGWMRVEHGRHPLAGILARRLRLPRSSAAVHAELTVTPVDGGERWLRTIGAERLETWQHQSDSSELSERFGCLEFRFRLAAADGRLVFVQREAALRFSARRLRLPRWLAPRIEAHEDAADARRVRVRVRITLPVVGLLIAYDGLIEVTGSRR